MALELTTSCRSTPASKRKAPRCGAFALDLCLPALSGGEFSSAPTPFPLPAIREAFPYFCLAMIWSLIPSYTFCGITFFATRSSLPL